MQRGERRLDEKFEEEDVEEKRWKETTRKN